MILVTLMVFSYLCSQTADIKIYDPGGASPGLTFQSEPIPAATLEERAAFWRSVWDGLIVMTILLVLIGSAWAMVLLLAPLVEGLDGLVRVLDRLRKVIFDSQMDAIQVQKSEKLANIDVDMAGAKFEHDREKALREEWRMENGE